MKRPSLIIGKLVVTIGNQAAGAPFMDSATLFLEDTKTGAKRSCKALAFLLKPWRRNQWGESLPQPILCFGWLKSATR
jgi:hypothetical protein